MIAGRPRRNVRIPHAQAGGTARKPAANANLVYVMEGDSAAMLPDEGDIFSNPFANFTEWDSEEDEKGFANL
jgi:hypothetical protein